MINGDLIIDCFAGGGGASVGIEMALGRHYDRPRCNGLHSNPAVSG